MQNPKIITTIVLVLLVIGALFIVSYFIRNDDGEVRGVLDGKNEQEIVSEYLRANIISLSKSAGVEAVLGGTFYVTSVDADSGNGVVYFEDGHIALAANFKYTFDADSNVVISAFVVRNEVNANTPPSEADIFK